MKKLDPSYVAGGNVRWCSFIGKQTGFLKEIPQRLNTELTQNPAILPLGTEPRERKTCLHKNVHMNVHSSIAHHNQRVETTQMSFSRGLAKHNWHIYNGVLFNHKNIEVLTHAASWMTLENIVEEARRTRPHIA